MYQQDMFVEKARVAAEEIAMDYNDTELEPMDSDKCIELTAVFHRWLQQASGNMSKEEAKLTDINYLQLQA